MWYSEYSGTCLIQHSFGLAKRLNSHLCTEIMSDRENSGLLRFQCILNLIRVIFSYFNDVSPGSLLWD